MIKPEYFTSLSKAFGPFNVNACSHVDEQNAHLNRPLYFLGEPGKYAVVRRLIGRFGTQLRAG